MKNINNELNEKKEWIICTANDISTNEDYPINIKILEKEWLQGSLNGLEVGDRVILKFLMNTSGLCDPLAFKNQKATVIKIEKYPNNYGREDTSNAKWVIVEFDNDELNNRKTSWIPIHFIKINN
jgi:hypothetical protein